MPSGILEIFYVTLICFPHLEMVTINPINYKLNIATANKTIKLFIIKVLDEIVETSLKKVRKYN